MSTTAWPHCPFHVGDRVYDYPDPRHIGRVNAIIGGCLAVVAWEETDWRSELAVKRLRHVEPTTDR